MYSHHVLNHDVPCFDEHVLFYPHMWCWLMDSNHQRPRLQRGALPLKLSQQFAYIHANGIGIQRQFLTKKHFYAMQDLSVIHWSSKIVPPVGFELTKPWFLTKYVYQFHHIRKNQPETRMIRHELNVGVPTIRGFMRQPLVTSCIGLAQSCNPLASTVFFDAYLCSDRLHASH